MMVRRDADLDEGADVRRGPTPTPRPVVTQSGKIRANSPADRAGMIGVNVGVAAPMAFFPFGGTKGSLYGDLKAHGKDAIRFFTDARVVISRWF